MILPKVWPESGKRPVCIHLAGTGDHVCRMFLMKFVNIFVAEQN